MAGNQVAASVQTREAPRCPAGGGVSQNGTTREQATGSGGVMEPRTELSVHVDDSFDAIGDDWRDLQSRGWTSVYQSYEWCRAWQESCGQALKVKPCLVSGRDVDGRLVFLLPLAVYPSAGCRVVRWLTYPACTYGVGVYDEAFLDSLPDGLAPYWPAVLAALPPADAVLLDSMPAKLHGKKHPLRGLFGVKDANSSYALDLQPDFDALYAELRPAKSRSRARSKDNKLKVQGDLRFSLPKPGRETRDVLATMLAQQTERLASRGIHGVFDAPTHDFIYKLAETPHSASAPRLLPYSLWLDDKLVAVKLGIEFDNTYWALISSLEANGIERLSPGDYALRQTIEACCKAGMKRLDMAAGDTGYKQPWATEEIQLYAISQALGVRGSVWAAASRAAATAKRRVKTSEKLWPIAQKLRSALLGRQHS